MSIPLKGGIFTAKANRMIGLLQLLVFQVVEAEVNLSRFNDFVFRFQVRFELCKSGIFTPLLRCRLSGVVKLLSKDTKQLHLSAQAKFLERAQ